MLADNHRQAAENVEQGIAVLQAAPGQFRLIIEAAWLAGFHWIVYGCHRKHGQHRDNHQGLAHFLDGLGEGPTAQTWRAFERVRQAGTYGNQANATDAQDALDLLAQARLFATT